MKSKAYCYAKNQILPTKDMFLQRKVEIPDVLVELIKELLGKETYLQVQGI